MSAVAAFSSPLAASSRRLSELEATRELSRIVSSGHDVTAVIEALGRLVLRVNGVKRLEVKYHNSGDERAPELLAWGSLPEDGAVVSAVSGISSGEHSWGELRLYFDLHASLLESPLRFTRFIAQQLGSHLSRWSLAVRAAELREQIEQLRKIVEKRKALQRARAILANQKRISDWDALLLIRKYSRESGRTLHEVAEALIFGDAQKWTGSRYAERKRPHQVFARISAEQSGD